jgi:DNA-binding beta-propeller fold protein YncE
MLYVASFLDTTLTAYSTANRSVVHRLRVALGLMGLGISPNGEKLYAGNDLGHLFVVPADLTGITKTVELYGNVSDPLFTPDGFYAVVPIGEYHGLPVLRTDSDEPAGWLRSTNGIYCTAAISPDGDKLFAVDSYRGRVHVYQRRAGTYP